MAIIEIQPILIIRQNLQFKRNSLLSIRMTKVKHNVLTTVIFLCQDKAERQGEGQWYPNKLPVNAANTASVSSTLRQNYHKQTRLTTVTTSQVFRHQMTKKCSTSSNLKKLKIAARSKSLLKEGKVEIKWRELHLNLWCSVQTLKNIRRKKREHKRKIRSH